MAAGILALLPGVLVYLVDRGAGSAVLIPFAGAWPAGPGFGEPGLWLPSFVHPLAFGLSTAVLLPAGPAWRVGGCLAWGAVNALFELGQHPRISTSLAATLLDGAPPEAAPWRGPLARYFVAGTFDSGDMLAIGAGTAVAIGLLQAASRRARVADAP